MTYELEVTENAEELNNNYESKMNSIEEAIEDIKLGKMVVVIDSPDRENEGDLLMAGELASTESINFMARYGRGLICMPASKKILDRLNIHEMVYENTDAHKTAFTVSIDYINTTTGISAYERALTIREVVNEKSKPSDFKRPGHVFPLIAKENGVLERAGHTEAAVDLAKLAGFKEVAVICEIMNDDGSMMRTKNLIGFSKKHDLKIITIKDLISYRKNNIMKREVSTSIPTKYGTFKMHGYVNQITGKHHLALVYGDIKNNDEAVLTRIHSECFTGDIFGSERCDCGCQLDKAMELITEKGKGIILYLRQEGRGIGLINKLKSYVLQDEGYDTIEANIKLGFPADMRDFTEAALMLKDLNIKKVDLITNNPKKIDELNANNIEVVKRIPIEIKSNKNNEFYLKTKKEKMNHLFEDTN